MRGSLRSRLTLSGLGWPGLRAALSCLCRWRRALLPCYRRPSLRDCCVCCLRLLLSIGAGWPGGSGHLSGASAQQTGRQLLRLLLGAHQGRWGAAVSAKSAAPGSTERVC